MHQLGMYWLHVPQNVRFRPEGYIQRKATESLAVNAQDYARGISLGLQSQGRRFGRAESRLKETGETMTRSNARIISASVLVVGVLLPCCLPLAAQDNDTYINRATRFAVSPPLRDLSKLPPQPQYAFHEANRVRRIPRRPVGPVVDTVEQSSAPVGDPAYSIIADFIGVGNGFPNYSVIDAPPDTNMAVGDTQIVQWVNVSYTVCQKTSPYTCGSAIDGNTIWTSLGGICGVNNDGSAIAQWDVTAHRWILAQNVLTGNYGICVAVSTSPDATGTYYLYEFPALNNGYPDYPKWGIWPTGYFQTYNNFGPGDSGFLGAVFCAYNSAKLLVGDQTAEQICHQYLNIDDSLLPADRDSPTAPPAGQDEFAIGSVGRDDNGHLSLYSVHINNQNDWTKGASFNGNGNSQLIRVSPYGPSCNGAYGGTCVPQKGIPDLLDSLGDRLMYRFAYWEDQPLANVFATPPLPVPAQHWLVNFDVAASSGNIGPRWMEITAPIKKVSLPTDLAKLTVFQQGTYAPDGNWRWMGSIARDKVGDILLGYSESCGSTCPGGTLGGVYPSVYIAGRQVNDPLGLGNLEAEVQVIGGAGSQPDTSNLWGGYSSMRIDEDGCTFWYTQEYYLVTQPFDWSTQVASAKFSNCN